ncbi:MAG: hypothetical protein RMK34_10600 [Tepidimonas sp.]|nr:hypothetical protein [Tepidimonas sp.]MDW8337399.1 hypothetical protein [Tepidimonas sp.]
MDDLWAGAALLARWFRFQPSEIDGLEVEDFVRWLQEARRQIRAESGGD